ncbi:hypothetical protein LCGC14_1177220 [marine sediment metagenome]|uniref:Uncharacterized protein n=1 Tax=marine sediment metagenome TaxID=412755 RepID=A0A0F9MAY9_9ZZZZ
MAAPRKSPNFALEINGLPVSSFDNIRLLSQDVEESTDYIQPTRASGQLTLTREVSNQWASTLQDWWPESPESPETTVTWKPPSNETAAAVQLWFRRWGVEPDEPLRPGLLNRVVALLTRLGYRVSFGMETRSDPTWAAAQGVVELGVSFSSIETIDD